MAFTGFSDETVDFFEGLLQDNSRDYFLARKRVYEASVRQPLHDLLSDLAVEFGGAIKIFRPNRDVRFSLDKSPYKTNAAGLLRDRPGSDALLYVSVSADGLHAAAGYYGIAKDQVTRFRRALTAGDDAVALGSQLRSLVDAHRTAGDEISTDAMTGMPRGFSKDHANADLIRYRHLAVGRYLEPEKMADASALDWVADLWRSAAPLNAWLDKYVGASTLPPERGSR